MKNKNNTKIKALYTEKQVCFDSIQDHSFSQSPLKPSLIMNRIKNSQFNCAFDIVDDFSPYKREDFLTAHTKEYVDNVFTRRELIISNSSLNAFC